MMSKGLWKKFIAIDLTMIFRFYINWTVGDRPLCIVYNILYSEFYMNSKRQKHNYIDPHLIEEIRKMYALVS